MILSVNILDIVNGWYGYYKSVFGKRVFCPVGREFFLDNIECGFESEKVYLTLSTEYGDKIVSHMLPRDELTQQGMNVLSGKGFDVKHWELVQSIIALLEEEYFENNSMKSFHQGIGWDKTRSEYQKELFPSKDGYVYKRYGYIDKTKSRYAGNFDIKPRGDYKKQKQFIKDEVCGYTPSEIAVAVGLSAVVNGRIQDIVHTPNLIVHFYGDSSRGKTTAAQLAVSVAGIPDIQSTSLFMSWNATSNAIIARLKMNHGMPVAMDEISKYNGNQMSAVVYALSDGRDRERLNKDATLRTTDKSDSFTTVIVSTGESTLIGKCNNNTGLKTRVIEIDTQFTKSANHANVIKENCMQNCGYLAPKLAKYMQVKGIDYVMEKYWYWLEEYMSRTTTSNLKERISANYALILTAADLANEAFKFNFDIDKMINLFIQNEIENDSETDIAKAAHEKLIDFAKTHHGHFTKFNTKHGRLNIDYQDVNDSIEAYGRIDTNMNKAYDDNKVIVGEYGFTREAFKKIVLSLGYEDEKVLLKKLKQAGYLNHEQGKMYRKRKLRKDDSSNTNMYVLYEFKDTSTDEDDNAKEVVEEQLDDTFTPTDDDFPI